MIQKFVNHTVILYYTAMQKKHTTASDFNVWQKKHTTASDFNVYGIDMLRGKTSSCKENRCNN